MNFRDKNLTFKWRTSAAHQTHNGAGNFRAMEHIVCEVYFQHQKLSLHKYRGTISRDLAINSQSICNITEGVGLLAILVGQITQFQHGLARPQDKLAP